MAGMFALVSALARPVELWRISVLSHRGQPLHAVADIESAPDERITDACLSLGPQTDAPGSDAPFLANARLTLNPAGTRVEIRGDQAIHSPTLALVLRVQCPGEMLYARHFGLLIPPAPAAAPPAPPVPGFKLKVARGETVESLARLLIPDDRRLREKMIREVLARNSHVFPDGRRAEVAPGTLLFFPDLRILRDLPERKAASAAIMAGPAPAAAAPAATKPAVAKPRPAAPDPETVGADATPAPQALAPTPDELPPAAAASDPTPRQPEPAKPSRPQSATPKPPASPSTPEPAAPQVRLQPTLELGANPTAQQCSQAMALCGAVPGIELEQRARATEQSAAALRLRQDSIEQQLQRLEKSVQSLQRAVAQATPAAAPAKPEARPVVKTGPMPWYYGLGLLAAVLAGAIGGFVFGRRRAFSDAAVEDDQRLDRMLATAAATIREMETTPVRKPPAAPRAVPPAPAPPAKAPVSEMAAQTKVDARDETGEVPQPEPGAKVDLELESGPTDQPAGLSNDLLFEMDQALDNTRSMFTDVDRFIALGRTQNAISLLQFQVHKDPKDRDSWIKLMAIYRQEKMDADLAKAAREFKRNFPDEIPPV